MLKNFLAVINTRISVGQTLVFEIRKLMCPIIKYDACDSMCLEIYSQFENSVLISNLV